MATMPSSAPNVWTNSPIPSVFGRPQLDDIDDLNRLTLAATCEVLPACRDRGVTLLVGLAADPIQVKGDSHRLERTVACLLEEASRISTMTGAGARVRVETARTRTHGEVRVITAGVIATGLSPEVFPAASRVLAEHGGTLRVVEEPGRRITMHVRLPVHVPDPGRHEDRIEVPGVEDSPARPVDDIRAYLPPAGRIKPVPAFMRDMTRAR